MIAEPPPDHLFEVTESSLAAVSPRQPSDAHLEIFPEQSLAISPNAPNVLRPALLQVALPKLVSEGPPKRSLAALVIPDYSVRMALLDFEEFPKGEEERNALVRFRLRKSIPFAIDEAQVAYSEQVNQDGHIEILAVAMARPILQEYEQVFTGAGYRLGMVTPSCVAALPLYGREPGLSLVAKAAGSVLTVLLLEQSRVRLVRCLDLTSSDIEHGSDQESPVLPLLQQTLAYAEDQIGQTVSRMLFSGFGSETDVLGLMAETEFGVPYAAVRSRFGAASQENTGLLGLLEQYAA